MDYVVEEIGKEFFLIRSPEKTLHRNIYLKRFLSPDKKYKFNMIFDPGTPSDYEFLFKKLKELIGGIQNIHLIFLSHQDPDLTSNSRTLLTAAPQSLIVTSVDTYRLVNMYGITTNKFRLIEPSKTGIVKIPKTEHRIRFIPAYFCHFRGAMMVYDYESGVLFSGDFLGGVNTDNDNKSIYADESSFNGISIFHQIYMPSKKALSLTINRIGLLNPIPEIIAPQHGKVIKGELVLSFLNRLSNLDVGLDLMEWNENEKTILLGAFNSFLDSLKEVDKYIYKNLLARLKNVSGFTEILVFTGDFLTDIKVSPEDAIGYIVKNLYELDKNTPYFTMFDNILTLSGLPYKLPKLKIEEEPKEKIFENEF
jgi:glyoxylase-like metal-dependent hydrolase (beta-lactamase superfamily II)